MQTTSSIPVTFDKSHIITIGEKLYGESLELIRELVCNAYDADATSVWIEIAPDKIKVRDDGSGMDELGLREYFNIGSKNKCDENISPKFRRQRVGQFGIGKFATLTACGRFRVFTQKGESSIESIFDRQDWFQCDNWSVPLKKHEHNPEFGQGTLVTLEHLKKTFTLPEVERYIRERLPLSAPHFEVFLNGIRIEPTYIPGKKFEIDVRTTFGAVHGEVILPNLRGLQISNKTGVECIVRGVLVCRENFGFESSTLFHRLRGRITADFLPITSDRNRFITDTPEYESFITVVQRELRKILKTLKKDLRKKEDQKADENLRETLGKIGKAMRKNPAFAPPVMSPTGEIDENGNSNADKMAPQASPDEQDGREAFTVNLSDDANPDDNPNPAGEPANKKPTAARKVRVKDLSGKTLTARKIKVGGLGVTCVLEHCGRDFPPAFMESGIIYLNRDHPLYRKQEARNNKENLNFYLGSLITQQVALLRCEHDARRMVEIQNQLLTDSF
ncbi:MAG: ATP-binding protein [Patescibacteria group bacterium]